MSERDEGRATMERRGFLKTLGMSGVVALSACERLPVDHALPFLVPPDELTPGTPIRYASTCGACPAACGLLVTVRDGRPIKLEGDPAHPLSRGGLCALGQGHLRGLYDAGRLRAPTVGGAKASWAALDEHVMRGLEAARAAGKSVHVLSETFASPAAKRAAELFAAAHDAVWSQWDGVADGGAAATIRAYSLLDGRSVLPSLDFAPVDRLVVFASDFLASGSDPVGHTRGYASRRNDGHGFQHLQVEGNLTLTAPLPTLEFGLPRRSGVCSPARCFEL